MHALTFSRFGDPDVLEWTSLPDPQPHPESRSCERERSG